MFALARSRIVAACHDSPRKRIGVCIVLLLVPYVLLLVSRRTAVSPL